MGRKTELSNEATVVQSLSSAHRSGSRGTRVTEVEEVEIEKLTVQDDNTVSTDDGQELKWWKRTKAQIRVEKGTESGEFEAILDTRSRVLRFIGGSSVKTDIRSLAQAVVFEMASFSTESLSGLLQERSQSADGQSVWMATDAELVSGLLHQVKESGAFTPRDKAPMAPALQRVLDDVLASVDRNLHSSYEWTQGHPTNPLAGLDFNTHAWIANGDIVLDYLEPTGAREAFVEFFDQTSTYGAIVQRARSRLARTKAQLVAQGAGDMTKADRRPYEEWAREGITQQSYQYQQTGLRLLRQFEDCLSDEQRGEMHYVDSGD